MFAMPDIDGGLIGGASLVAEGFPGDLRAAGDLADEVSVTCWINADSSCCTCWSALAIIGLVLLQHGKGADMGAGFGSGASGSLFGATGSAQLPVAHDRGSRRGVLRARASRSPTSRRRSRATAAAA